MKDADFCIVMNEWDEFKRLKPGDFADLMKSPNVVDASRIFDPGEFREVRLLSVGLGPSPVQS